MPYFMNIFPTTLPNIARLISDSVRLDIQSNRHRRQEWGKENVIDPAKTLLFDMSHPVEIQIEHHMSIEELNILPVNTCEVPVPRITPFFDI